MGAAGSVVDPAALRKEYETKSAENVSDAELLAHMKKLIISAPSGMPSFGRPRSFAVTAAGVVTGDYATVSLN